MIKDYWQFDGLALAELVRSGQIDARELLETAVTAAAAANKSLNFISHDLADMALSTPATSLPGAPFAGVPFLLKDIGAQMKDTPYECGSRIMKGFVSRIDSNLTARFRDAGLVTFAKTTTPEFGAQIMTETILCGITRNPWNTDHTPGGSSGGSAAAVAAGVVPFAHANDGLGSIRIPASNCGLFGLKPTRQRTPCGPEDAEIAGGRGVEFVVSRTVRDSAALLDAVHGTDVGAPHCAPPPARSYQEELHKPRKELRIALMTSTFTGRHVEDSCRQAAEDTARLCEKLGHHVAEAAPVLDFESYLKAVRIAATASMTSGLRKCAAGMNREPSPDNLEKINWLFYLEGKRILAFEYFKALDTYATLQRAMGAFFTNYDILITPMLTRPPAMVGWLGQPDDDLDGWWAKFGGDEYSPFAGVFNVTGHPAASIPLHHDAANLPIGTHLVGRFGDEGALFSLAGQLEAARPWIARIPPVHVSRLL